MGDYARPTTAPISATWADHRNRNPPSSEPGTDYACAYGTELVAAQRGTVVDVNHSTAGGTGRYLTLQLDDGRRVRYLHLSEIWAGVGWALDRGQVFGRSGASGFGSDWGYGAHVHTSLWERAGLPISQTIDFENHVGEPPPPPPPPIPDTVGGNMILMHNQSSPEQYVLLTVDSGEFRARYLEDPYERAAIMGAYPKIPITPCDDITFQGILDRCGYSYGAPIPLLDVNTATITAAIPARFAAGAAGLAAAVVLLLHYLLSRRAG